MDINKTWEDAKKRIADKVSSVSFDLWIKTLEAEAFEDGAFILAATSTMAKQQACNERHFPHIESEIKDLAPIVEKVTVIDAIEKEQRDNAKKGITAEQSPDTPKQPGPVGTPVNPNQTFATFIVGKSNEVVAAAAEAVAKTPGKRINPLFIYGGSGLGKTHLLNAIANYIMTEYPKLHICFVSSEKFTNDYVYTMMNSKTAPVAAFREKYRNVDILLIDDIQFIHGKDGTQEEFFHTFNDLVQNGRQVVITSDRHPDEMSKLEERMRSRFKSGLIQDVGSPDAEMRIAILRKKAALENYRLSDAVVEYLAMYAVDHKMNVRDMQGNLSKVIFYAGLRNRPEPTLEDCHDALKETTDDKKFRTTAETIIGHICKYFSITREDIIGPRRNREFVEPRMFAIYLITEFLNIPLVNIGQILGNRDHTTIMHGRNKIMEKLQSGDPRTKRIITDISKMIKSE